MFQQIVHNCQILFCMVSSYQDIQRQLLSPNPVQISFVRNSHKTDTTDIQRTSQHPLGDLKKRRYKKGEKATNFALMIKQETHVMIYFLNRFAKEVLLFQRNAQNYGINLIFYCPQTQKHTLSIKTFKLFIKEALLVSRDKPLLNKQIKSIPL